MSLYVSYKLPKSLYAVIVVFELLMFCIPTLTPLAIGILGELAYY